MVQELKLFQDSRLISHDYFTLLMLQRIQTLFLAIVSIGMVGFLALPVWSKTSPTENAVLDAFQLVHHQGISSYITPTWYIAVLAVLVAGVAAFAITRFKNRLVQSALCALNSILMTALMATVLYFSYSKGKNLFDPQEPGSYQLGFFALLVAMLSNVLANRFIRRDERMVKESERMR